MRALVIVTLPDHTATDEVVVMQSLLNAIEKHDHLA